MWEGVSDADSARYPNLPCSLCRPFLSRHKAPLSVAIAVSDISAKSCGEAILSRKIDLESSARHDRNRKKCLAARRIQESPDD
jgi:hypothetical protein